MRRIDSFQKEWAIPVDLKGQPIQVRNSPVPSSIQTYKTLQFQSNSVLAPIGGFQWEIVGGYCNHTAGGGTPDKLVINDIGKNIIADIILLIGANAETGDYPLCICKSVLSPVTSLVFGLTYLPKILGDGFNISLDSNPGSFVYLYVRETKT